MKKCMAEKKISGLTSLISNMNDEQVKIFFDREAFVEEGSVDKLALNLYEDCLVLYEELPLTEIFMNDNFVLPFFLQDEIFVGSFSKDHNPNTYDFIYRIFTYFIHGPKVDQCIFRNVVLDEGQKIDANIKHQNFIQNPFPFPENVHLIHNKRVL